MAKTYLKDARVFIGGYDVSAQHNYITLELGRATLPATDFTQDTETHKLGLRTVKISGRGFWEAGAEVTNTPKKIDDILFADFDLEDIPVTIVPSIGVAGGVAYAVQSTNARLHPILGQHGALVGIEYEIAATKAAVVRGKVLHAGTIAADGNGVALQLGAVPLGKRIYGILHAYGFAIGSTIDMKIQSDNAVGFPSAIDRIVFGQKNGFAAEWAQLSAATVDPVLGITDDWWRVVKDVSVAGSFDVIALAGIRV